MINMGAWRFERWSHASALDDKGVEREVGVDVPVYPNRPWSDGYFLPAHRFDGLLLDTEFTDTSDLNLSLTQAADSFSVELNALHMIPPLEAHSGHIQLEFMDLEDGLYFDLRDLPVGLISDGLQVSVAGESLNIELTVAGSTTAHVYAVEDQATIKWTFGNGKFITEVNGATTETDSPDPHYQRVRFAQFYPPVITHWCYLCDTVMDLETIP